MPIKHVRFFLMDYMRGLLSKEERELVEAHLERCTSCKYDLQNLKETESALQTLHLTPPDPSYVLSIVHRVRARLENRYRAKRTFDNSIAKIILPLAASALCIFMVIEISTTDVSHQPIEALKQATNGLTYDEVMEGVDSQSLPLSSSSNRDAEEVIMGEQLLADHFIRDVLLEQIESGDIADANIDDMVSVLSKEQIDQLLESYRERNNL